MMSEGPIPTMDNLGLKLENTHVLITGGSGYIGSVTITALLTAGCLVTSLDIKPPVVPVAPSSTAPSSHPQESRFLFVHCDISSEDEVESAFRSAKKTFGVIKCCIALASLDLSVLVHHPSMADMSVEQWRRTHQINVEGTFLTARMFLRQLRDHVAEMRDEQDSAANKMDNVSLIVVGSESGLFGEHGNADYAAGKSAVQGGLLKSLMGDIVRIWSRGRVNAVAPGPVDTAQFQREIKENPLQLWLDAQATTAMKMPVPPEQVAKSILFLASENWNGNIMGQVIQVDSGKLGKVHWLKNEC